MDTQTAQSLQQLQDRLCCPKCTGTLEIEPAHVVCTHCRQDYPSVNNIPLLFWPNEWGSTKEDVTEVVKAFYEETPFPNYDDFDNVGSLVHKARQGIVARLLDEQLPFGSSILECGCGTGQLSNFLSVANRTVVATDMCLNSLSLGQAFKEKNKLKRVHFVQMNLFRPIFQPESFDFVICNGVLHHTADPFLGYKTLAILITVRSRIESRRPSRR